MPKPMLFICILLFVLSLTNVSYSEFYKWVDENGVTVYSEFPPPDMNVDKVYETYKSDDNQPSETTSNKRNNKKSKKQAEKKNIKLNKSDLSGKWIHLGGSTTFSSNKLSKPYKPQSWNFTRSGMVTYRIGNKKNTFPYKIKGNQIITEPFKGEYLNFEVVYKQGSKMIWKDYMGGYIHVKRN